LFDARLRAAHAIEHAASALAEAFSDFFALSQKAYHAWPGPLPDIGGLAVGVDEISALVGAELFRHGGQPSPLGGQPGQGVPPLPAPKSPGFEYVNEPRKVPSLVSAVTAANDVAKRLLEGNSR
jgi:hypothetical protein